MPSQIKGSAKILFFRFLVNRVLFAPLAKLFKLQLFFVSLFILAGIVIDSVADRAFHLN